MGVIAGTIALFIVLSVFSGIQEYSLSILDANTPDIRITPKKGKSFIADANFTDKLNSAPDTIFYSKVLEERAFFKNKDKEAIAYVKGVDSLFHTVTPLGSAEIIGEWFSPLSTNSCTTTFKLARELDLSLYTDRLFTYVPKTGTGYITDPKNAFRSINPQIIGFITNQAQQENDYVYIPLSLCQKLLGKLDNEVSYIDIRVLHIESSDKILTYLKDTFPLYNISKREELNSSFYKILNSEKLIAYLVSLLVVMMVLSNTSGTIIMVIVDKKKDINTLVKVGASLKNIRQIFTIYGFLLNLIGMFIGLILGSLLILLQINFELIMITPTIPYPVAFDWKNILIVCSTIIIFGALASLLASGRISKRFLQKP